MALVVKPKIFTSDESRQLCAEIREHCQSILANSDEDKIRAAFQKMQASLSDPTLQDLSLTDVCREIREIRAEPHFSGVKEPFVKQIEELGKLCANRLKQISVSQGRLGTIREFLPLVNEYLPHEDWYRSLVLVNKSLRRHFEKSAFVQYQRLFASLVRVVDAPRHTPVENGQIAAKDFWINFIPTLSNFRFNFTCPQEGIAKHPCFQKLEHVKVVDMRHALLYEIAAMKNDLIKLKWKKDELIRSKEEKSSRKELKHQIKAIKKQIKEAKAFLREVNDKVETEIVEDGLLKGKAVTVQVGHISSSELPTEKEPLRELLGIDDVAFRLENDFFTDFLFVRMEGGLQIGGQDNYEPYLRGLEVLELEDKPMPVTKELRDLLVQLSHHVEELSRQGLKIPQALERLLPVLIHVQNMEILKVIFADEIIQELIEECQNSGFPEAVLDIMEAQLPLHLAVGQEARAAPANVATRVNTPEPVEAEEAAAAAAAPVAAEAEDSDTDGED